MNRRLTFLVAAFEAALAAAIGIGIVLAPLTVIWLIENDPSIDWLVAFRTSADLWLLAHGTRLVVPASTFAGAELPLYIVSLIPLGYTALIAFMAFRIGRRLTAASELWPGISAVVTVYGAVSLFVSTAAADPAIYPVNWQGTFFPPTLFAFFAILGGLFGRRSPLAEGLPEPFERRWLRSWWLTQYDRMHWALRALLVPALRTGTAIVATLFTISAIAVGLLLAVNWIQVIRLYEALQVSFLGGTAVTVGQLALLPNLIIYGVGWLLGPGFQIGAGSLISPIGTAVGPLPSIPLIAVLPIGQLELGMMVLVIPVTTAFIITVLAKKFSDEIRFEFASSLNAALAVAFSVAAVVSIEVLALAVLASGSAGPGRLEIVGLNPVSVAAAAFIITVLAAFLGAFFSAKPESPDNPIGKRG